MLRVLISDVDIDGGIVTVREKKRVKGKRSTRAAPLTPKLTEAPRFLFLSSPQNWFGDGILLTDTGGCRVARADKIGDDGGGFHLLTPEIKPWVGLWPAGGGLPREAAEYDVVTSRRWGFSGDDIRAIVLRRAGVGAETEAFTIQPRGAVPNFLPDQNPFVAEFAKKYKIPVAATLGGAQTMYPEFQREMKAKETASPEK